MLLVDEARQMIFDFPNHLLCCLKRSNDMAALVHRRKSACEKIRKLSLHSIPGSQRVPSGLRKALLTAIKNESRSKTKKALNDVFDSCMKAWMAQLNKKGGRRSGGGAKTSSSSGSHRATVSSSSSSSSSSSRYATISHDDQDDEDEHDEYGDDTDFGYDQGGGGGSGYVHYTLSITRSTVLHSSHFLTILLCLLSLLLLTQ